jgi:sporulation protein YlmC with PRC-barrel domain
MQQRLSCQSKEEISMTDMINTDESNELIASNKVEGTTVYDVRGERIGTINYFMVDKISGQAEHAVMQFGGFLGIGADYYPIPWNLLSYDVTQGGYVVDIDKEQLDAAPRYSDQEPSFDAQYNQQVYTYYGVS